VAGRAWPRFKSQRVIALRNTIPRKNTPVLVKHSEHISLEDSLVIGVDRMQRNFRQLKQQVEELRATQLSTGRSETDDLPEPRVSWAFSLAW